MQCEITKNKQLVSIFNLDKTDPWFQNEENLLKHTGLCFRNQQYPSRKWSTFVNLYDFQVSNTPSPVFKKLG